MSIHCFTSLRARFLILIAIALQAQAQDSRLSLKNYNYTSASVLPITYLLQDDKLVKYVILGQEANPRKRDEYDDFGGRRDDNDIHPLQTAAREFYEEAIVPATLGWNLDQTEKYIDLKSAHTFLILAAAKHVIYFTLFSPLDIALVKYKFYKARESQKLPMFKEKKRIASVKWDLFEATIKNSTSNKNISVQANVINPATGIEEKTQIQLRPGLVKRLKPLFLNKLYQVGKKPQIRFY